MGILALIQTILGLPAAFAKLMDEFNAIKARMDEIEKEKQIVAVQQTEKDTAAAQSDADYAKASADNAKNLGKL